MSFLVFYKMLSKVFSNCFEDNSYQQLFKVRLNQCYWWWRSQNTEKPELRYLSLFQLLLVLWHFPVSLDGWGRWNYIRNPEPDISEPVPSRVGKLTRQEATLCSVTAGPYLSLGACRICFEWEFTNWKHSLGSGHTRSKSNQVTRFK